MISTVDAGKGNSGFEGLSNTKSMGDADVVDSSSEGLNMTVSAVFADAGMDSNSESPKMKGNNAGRTLGVVTTGGNLNSERDGA